jgi:hypothetical protein
MTKQTLVIGGLACLTLLAGNSTFSAINACGACGTEPIGINNRGQVAGTAYGTDGNTHGFLKDGGAYTVFDVPNSVFTEAGHINNSGQIACDYVSADDGIDRPCIRNADGSFDLRPAYPGAAVTFAAGITDNGLLAGSYTNDPNGATGFVGYILSGKQFVATFSYPARNVTSTYVLGINNAGTVLGSYQTTTPGEEHGFIRTASGTFQQVDYPGAIQTELFGVNTAGTMVGRYRDARGVNHGFQLRGDRFLSIEHPDPKVTADTQSWDINDADEIIGFACSDGNTPTTCVGYEVAATTAIAGPNNFSTSLTQIQLDGTQSIGSLGKPLTWNWTLAPGSPYAIISNANTPNPLVQFFAGPGTYQFSLTVTDVNGKTATDTATVNYIYRR